MRILEHFDVKFSGPLKATTRNRFTLQNDDGTIFDVMIPGEEKLLAAFRWMGENDCLRHLRSVEPEYHDNLKDIMKIEEYNTQVREHAHLVGSLQTGINYNNYSPQHYSSNGYPIPQLQPVPSAVYECTWTFYSKEHAVMFKLACG